MIGKMPERVKQTNLFTSSWVMLKDSSSQSYYSKEIYGLFCLQIETHCVSLSNKYLLVSADSIILNCCPIICLMILMLINALFHKHHKIYDLICWKYLIRVWPISTQTSCNLIIWSLKSTINFTILVVISKCVNSQFCWLLP